MKKTAGLIAKTALLFVMLFVLSSCSQYSADNLYAPPKGSDEYGRLQEQIDVFLNSGASYSPPVSGSNRQAVQLEDLDGDGNDEALVFLNIPSDSKPLKIYIYKEVRDGFTEVARLEGEGANLESIRYVDLNGDGSKEIVVGRQISTGIEMLTVYSTRGLEITSLMSTDYEECTTCDFDGDGNHDLFVIRTSASDQSREAAVFKFNERGQSQSAAAKLSRSVQTVSRLRTTKLGDGKNAIIAEGRHTGGEYFTDIFYMDDDGALEGLSSENYRRLLRTVEIYAKDVNRDGAFEVPMLVPLAAQKTEEGDDMPQSNEQYIIKWQSFSSDGTMKLVKSTYNSDEGWYLEVPETWEGAVSVRNAEYALGERAVVFSAVGTDGQYRDFLIIYTLTAEDRAQRSRVDGRFVLSNDGEKIFAAKIQDYPTAERFGAASDSVKRNFGIIYSEWNTGEV